LGRNAILELSHKIVAVHQTNWGRPGLDALVVTTRGGPQSGMVPDDARALFDITFHRLEDIALVEERFRAIAAQNWVPDTHTEMTTILYHPPQERLPGTPQLVALAQAIGRELGVELKDTFSNGVADGSFASAEGVPTLCGLTPWGTAYHTRDEWLDLNQVVPRVTLVASLVAACASTLSTDGTDLKNG
jgi:glutamate carboxypeptidase